MAINTNKYDVVVVGSGPGGYVSAIRATQLGKKTAVVERENLGGVCLNWGCIPTKALLESARLLDEMRNAKSFGLKCEAPTPDWNAVIKRSRLSSTKMSKGVEFLMKKNKIDVIKGHGEFKSSTVLKVNTNDGVEEISADNFIIATGARPRALPGFEFDGKNIISSKEAMILPEIPKQMLIIGAGAIGVEFAYLYSIMGSKVTIVELMDQVVPVEDKEVAITLERLFVKRGINVHTASKVTNIKKKKTGAWTYTIEGKKGETTVDADVCLVAVGVQANTDEIGLEKMNVETDRGFIKVDDHLKTNVKGIYAIGDVAGPPLLAHVASHEGICAAETISGLDVPGIDHSNVPGCTYCHPQIASVGMSEAKAKEAGYEIKTGKYMFRANGRAVAGGETDGFVKFVIDTKYNEVLGVHIIGPGAPELIGEVVLGREFELTATDFAKTIHAHPTLSEAVMEAAGDALGEAIHT